MQTWKPLPPTVSYLLRDKQFRKEVDCLSEECAEATLVININIKEA